MKANKTVDFENLSDFSILHRRFEIKFQSLRDKVHRVMKGDLDSQSYDIYVNSILIDCRVLFIENPRYKNNCTIQNFYKATGNPQYAESIDEHFDGKIKGELTLRTIIKDWVDQHLVHLDFVDEQSEQSHFENILSIIDKSTLNNIFIDILLIAKQHHEYRMHLREKANSIMEYLTGGNDGPTPSENNKAKH